MSLNRVTSIAFATLIATVSAAEIPKSQANRSYGNLPLILEKNQGQTDGRVDFLARGGGYTLFLTPGEAVLRLGGSEPSVIRMKVVGARPDASREGGGELPG